MAYDWLGYLTIPKWRLELLRKAAYLAPNDAIIRARLARAYLFQRDADRALREFENAMTLAPNSVDVMSIGGEIYDRTGKFDLLLDLWDEIHTINPGHPPTINWWKARAAISEKNWDDAIYWLDRNGMPEFHWTLFGLAAAHCAKGEIDAGKSELTRGLSIMPYVAEAYWDEADFWNMGKDTEALVMNWREGLIACGLDIPERPTVVN